MSATAKKIPFGVKQHVRAEAHQGVGNPNDVWNWTPKKGVNEIVFDEAIASDRTRTNTNGIADQGEYY
jgi:hypothetical protein